MSRRSVSAEARLRLRPSELFRRAIGEPDPWQARYLDDRSPRLVVVTGRQVGKSSCTAAKAVHYAWRHPGTTSVVIAPTQDQSSLLVDRARGIAGALPPRDRPVRDAKTRLGFPNGSQLVALPGDRPSSPRGWTVDGVLIADEAGWIKDATWEAALPTVQPGASIAVLSTPNGKGGFLWRLWNGEDAEGDGVEWKRVKVPAAESGRYTERDLAERRRDLGSDLRYSVEYECVFATSAASVFAPEWLATATTDRPDDGLSDDDLMRMLA